MSFHKVTDTFYKVDDAEEYDVKNNNEQPTPTGIGAGAPDNASVDEEPKASVIGDSAQCTVCMDASADTVMMPCAHGGICYDCAEALVRKHLLYGGAKCIHCRTPIDSLVKLSDMHDQVASGVEIEIPKATVFLK